MSEATQKPLYEKWKNPTDKSVRFQLGGGSDGKNTEFPRQYEVQPGETILVPSDHGHAIKGKGEKGSDGQMYYAGVAPQLERVDDEPAKVHEPAKAPAKEMVKKS